MSGAAAGKGEEDSETRVRRVSPCRIMGAMSATPESALPIRLTVDDSDSPSDVVDALFLGRFATGEQPYSHSSSLERVKAGATLLPLGRQGAARRP